ncbi:MAG TPA: hypothetical protein VL282_19315, partial [Tepidisphaeraceae bacterium]|nr:hypothetical protein [Tepidisphaeraceae bacterium]
MKSIRFIASMMLAAGMVAGSTAAFADDANPSSPASQATAVSTTTPAVATTQQSDPRVTEQITAIQNAADPSAVVEAYAKAQVAAPDSLPVEEAYVARLVSLGLPELAESQARDLTR